MLREEWQGLTSPSSDETHVRIHLENKLSDSHAFVRHFVPAKSALCLSPVRRGFKRFCVIKTLKKQPLPFGSLVRG